MSRERLSLLAAIPDDVTDPLMWRLALDVTAAHHPDHNGNCRNLPPERVEHRPGIRCLEHLAGRDHVRRGPPVPVHLQRAHLRQPTCQRAGHDYPYRICEQQDDLFPRAAAPAPVVVGASITAHRHRPPVAAVQGPQRVCITRTTRPTTSP
ncbi:hypothetical protein E1193_05070 [Micromonospora sp. KC606]|nr:hypothetical protein E1193_05070 [Micromonospora sp. KC606]